MVKLAHRKEVTRKEKNLRKNISRTFLGVAVKVERDLLPWPPREMSEMKHLGDKSEILWDGHTDFL